MEFPLKFLSEDSTREPRQIFSKRPLRSIPRIQRVVPPPAQREVPFRVFFVFKVFARLSFVPFLSARQSPFVNIRARGGIKSLLVDASVEDTLGEDLLGDLGSHVGVAKLSSNEDASNLGLLGVDLVDLHLNTTLGDVKGLVVLREHGIVTGLSGLKTGKGDGHVIAGGSSAALGVEEEASTVRRGGEVTSHLEAGLEGGSVAGGLKGLDGEEEGDTLATGKLDGGGGVVNSFLLLEDNLASLGLEGSLDAIKGVGLAGHDLGVDELLLGLACLSDLLLNGPGLGLDAHLSETGSRLGGDGVLTDDLGATVGKTGSLDLQVGELVKLGLGDGLGGAGSDGEAEGDGDGGFAEVLLEGHVELSRALQDKEERGGAIFVSVQAHRRTEEKL